MGNCVKSITFTGKQSIPLIIMTTSLNNSLMHLSKLVLVTSSLWTLRHQFGRERLVSRQWQLPLWLVANVSIFEPITWALGQHRRITNVNAVKSQPNLMSGTISGWNSSNWPWTLCLWWATNAGSLRNILSHHHALNTNMGRQNGMGCFDNAQNMRSLVCQLPKLQTFF